MATEMDGFFYTGLTAENDLSAKQYFIVEAGASAGQVDVTDAATDTPIGVLMNDPTAGQAALVKHDGIGKVESDGSGTAISMWDALANDASGRAVVTTTDNDWIIGYALEASSASGTIIKVLLRCPQRY